MKYLAEIDVDSELSDRAIKSCIFNRLSEVLDLGTSSIKITKHIEREETTMKEKIRLKIAKFNNAFVIQILDQDMEYTKEIHERFIHGFPCNDGWRIFYRNYPDIDIERKRIFLRGAEAYGENSI